MQDVVYTRLYTLYCIQSFLYVQLISGRDHLSWVHKKFAGCHFDFQVGVGGKKFFKFVKILKNKQNNGAANSATTGWCLHWNLGTLICVFNLLVYRV